MTRAYWPSVDELYEGQVEGGSRLERNKGSKCSPLSTRTTPKACQAHSGRYMKDSEKGRMAEEVAVSLDKIVRRIVTLGRQQKERENGFQPGQAMKRVRLVGQASFSVKFLSLG